MFSTLKGETLDCQVFTKRSVVAAVNEELYRQWFRWLRENDDRSLSTGLSINRDRTNQ